MFELTIHFLAVSTVAALHLAIKLNVKTPLFPG